MKFERNDTVRRNVGKCPACRGNLWAEVQVVTTLQSPRWTDQGDHPQAVAFADPVAMTLSHHCDNRDEE